LDKLSWNKYANDIQTINFYNSNRSVFSGKESHYNFIFGKKIFEFDQNSKTFLWEITLDEYTPNIDHDHKEDM